MVTTIILLLPSTSEGLIERKRDISMVLNHRKSNYNYTTTANTREIERQRKKFIASYGFKQQTVVNIIKPTILPLPTPERKATTNIYVYIYIWLHISNNQKNSLLSVHDVFSIFDIVNRYINWTSRTSYTDGPKYGFF